VQKPGGSWAKIFILIRHSAEKDLTVQKPKRKKIKSEKPRLVQSLGGNNGLLQGGGDQRKDDETRSSQSAHHLKSQKRLPKIGGNN